MKNTNLPWFLILTFWPAIIVNGWWVLNTCDLIENAKIILSTITGLLSLLYLIVLFVKFLDELDN